MGRSSTTFSEDWVSVLTIKFMTNEMAYYHDVESENRKWTGWDLNPWPPACKAGDLPLIYRPSQTLLGKDRCNSVNVNILFDRRGFKCLIHPSMSRRR